MIMCTPSRGGVGQAHLGGEHDEALPWSSPSPHELRRTAASLAVAAGANIKAVQRILGHASAAMTLDVYAKLFDDDLDAVADRLDQAAAQDRADLVRTDAVVLHCRRRAQGRDLHVCP